MNRSASATTAATVPTVDAAIDSLRDFPDRLSPIVVKELRQGLRQPAFVFLFILFHCILAFIVAVAMLGSSTATFSARADIGETISTMILGAFLIVALLLQPLRGLNAIASETRAHTIDLLFLSRLDAWQIVYGKWLSLVTQSALLMVTLFPYLIMRYFLGGMSLFAETSGLLSLFLIGAVFCAGAVGVSVVPSVATRGAVAVATAAVLIFVTREFTPFLGGWGWEDLDLSDSAWDLATAAFGGLLCLACLTYALLEFGATRIAPIAENRSTRKRLISLAALLLIPLFFLQSSMEALGLVAIILIAWVAIADASCESPHFVGARGRRRTRFLHPGWPSGALFSGLVVAIAIAWSVVYSIRFSTPSNSTASIGAIGVFLLVVLQPALAVAVFRPHAHQPAGFYLATLIVWSLLGGLVLFMFADSHMSDDFALSIFPMYPLIGLDSVDYRPDLIAGYATAALIGYLIAIAVIGQVAQDQQAAAGESRNLSGTTATTPTASQPGTTATSPPSNHDT